MLRTAESEARYREVFERHHRQIYAYFRRRIDIDSAMDCTSDTFLVAWRRLEDIPSGDGELRWLYTVARNVLRNSYRSKRRSRHLLGELDHDLPDTADTPDLVVVRGEEEREVIEAVRRLSRNDQEVLLLSVWEELPRDDIAVVLGCTPHAVSQRLHMATKRLAREIEKSSAIRSRSITQQEESA